MAELVPKKVRFTDSALIKNDVLRPWTIDLNLDRKLQQEAVALDKILSFTTPQKFAGTLASSVLDTKLQEYTEFKSTLDQRIKTGIITSTGIIDAPGSEKANSSSNSTRNSDSSRMASNRSDRANGGSSNHSRTMTPAVDDYECFTEADLAYIDRMKRSSTFKRSIRTSGRAQTAHHTQSIQGIRYSQLPPGPISPSRSKLNLTSYHHTKLRPNVSSTRLLQNHKVVPGSHS